MGYDIKAMWAEMREQDRASHIIEQHARTAVVVTDEDRAASDADERQRKIKDLVIKHMARGMSGDFASQCAEWEVDHD